MSIFNKVFGFILFLVVLLDGSFASARGFSGHKRRMDDQNSTAVRKGQRPGNASRPSEIPARTQALNTHELLLNILSYLPEDFSVSQVSSRFKAAERDRETIRFSVEGASGADLNLQRARVVEKIKVATKLFPRIHQVSLVSLDSFLTPELLNEVVSSWPNISSIDLRGVTLVEAHGKVLSQLPLREIKVSVPNTDSGFFTGLGQQQKLRSLMLSSVRSGYEGFSPVFPKLLGKLTQFPSLEELIFDQVNLSYANAQQLESLPQLKTVYWLDDYENSHNTAWAARLGIAMEGLSKVPSLRALYLSKGLAGPFFDLVKNREGVFQNLEVLAISGQGVELEDLEGIQNLKSLRKIILSGLISTDYQYESIAAEVSRLTRLEEFVLRIEDHDRFIELQEDEVSTDILEQHWKDSLNALRSFAVLVKANSPQLRLTFE